MDEPHGAESLVVAEPKRRGRRLARVLAWVVTLGLTCWIAPVTFAWHPGPLAWAVALAPWTVAVAAVAIALGVAARARGAVSLAVAAGLVAAAVQAPLVIPASRSNDHDGPVLTVMTLNLFYGEADAESVVTLVRDHAVDVLMLEELTPDAVAALDAAGLSDALPYSVVAAREGAGGTALFSRTEIGDPEVSSLSYFALVSGSIAPQGWDLRAVAVHTLPPGLINHGTWQADLAEVAAMGEDQTKPVLLAGDFNAVLEHHGMRDLHGLGFIDGVEQAGAGFLPTFPANAAFPPLAAIDHVLVRYDELVAIDAATFTVPGTDHRALVVTYGGP